MTAHVNAARRFSWENRDDVAQLDIMRDAPALRDHVRVETDLQPRTRFLELIEDPLPSLAKPVRQVRIREGVPSLKTREFRQQLLQALL
jgi:hypothetical protein